MSHIFLTTGPSVFSENVHSMIENELNANFIYCLNNKKENLDELCEKADSLFLGGGRDVFPVTYGSTLLKGENHENFDIARDKREVYLIKKFIEQDKGIFGICRGLQIYCSAFLGLTLTDANFSNANVVHSPSSEGIKLSADEQEFAHTIHMLGSGEDLHVNSFHHMCVILPDKLNTIPNDVEIVATAELGGSKNPSIIEWIRDHKNKVNVVQWHPENIYKTNRASQMFLESIKEMVG